MFKKLSLFFAALTLSAGLWATSIWSGYQDVHWDNPLTIEKSKFASALPGNKITITLSVNDGTNDAIVFKANGQKLPGTRFSLCQDWWETYDLFMTQDMIDSCNVYGMEIYGDNFTVTNIDLSEGKAASMKEGKAIWTGYFWVTSGSTLEVFREALDAVKDWSKYSAMRFYSECPTTDNLIYLLADDSEAGVIAKSEPATDEVAGNPLKRYEGYAELDLTKVNPLTVINALSSDRLKIKMDKQGSAGFNFTDVVLVEPDVRLASDILIIDEVYDIETGNLVGWNYTMHEPSVNNIMLRTNSTDKYGTFSFEDKTLTDEIYNITRITEEGYKQQAFISGSMTIDEVGDSIVLDGLFLCEDGKKYALHFTHLKAALNEDTNMDFDADFEYYQMSSYLDGGVISIEAYSNSGMVHLELYADPAATTIPAGVYSLSDTQEAGTALASSGVVDKEHTGCYAATLNTYTGDLHDLWFMTGGTITIGYDENGRLTIAVETTNSYGRNAHINVAYKPITPIATEEINNTSLFITNDAQRANVYDYMIYDEYGYLLAALMVKTDTLCGEFENAVDLPQCAIKVPGAIVPYYLIDAKPFTVSGEGKELSLNVSVLAADTILYVITGTGYIGAIYPDTKDNYNGQYTTEELKMKQVEDGLVELTATNADNDDMTIVIWATLEEDGTLAKGEYNEIMASEGITEENTVAPSAVVDANDNVWLIQSGKLTVAEDGSMVFEGLNTYDKKVTITIAPATALPANEVSDNVNKFMHEGQLIIRKAGKMYNILGVEVR